jgi:hypothetical protein
VRSVGRLRIVGLADTDSYLKWGASLLGSVSDAADVTMLVVETPLVVSEAQQRAALAGAGLPAERVRRVEFEELSELLRSIEPDAVLVAARGPLVRVLARLVAELTPRPVIVTGLPGISIPATSRALLFRAQCDLFVLHSTREMREFAALATLRGLSQRFGLSRLPFAEAARRGSSASAGGGDLVFAAQAIVPRERFERMQVAELLVAAAEADPSRRVVVKLRGAAGEKQTHREHDDYRDLLARIGRRRALPENLVVSTGPMARALDTAQGLMTVSSTAAIEAVARGVPVIALDTFGVSDQLINPVFVGSGLLAGESAVIARDFRHPDASWLADNYFHDPSMDAWFEKLQSLVAKRRAGALPPKPPLERRGGRARDVFERKIALGSKDRSAAGAAAMLVGWPLRFSIRSWNRVRGFLRGPVIWPVVSAPLAPLPSAESVNAVAPSPALGVAPVGEVSA